MSLSNPTMKNPATRFFQWSGGATLVEKQGNKEVYEGGKLTWYDKENQEQKTVEFSEDKPFVFIVLDELNTMKGFSDAEQSSFWSNEVRDMNKEILVVRTGSGVKARGTYKSAEIENIKSKGAKYAKSIYIAFKDETGELVMGNLTLSGAALTAWIELQKKYDVYQCAIALVGVEGPHKKGQTRYFTPEFEGRNVTPETVELAKKLDRELQRYLNTYFTRRQDDEEIAEDVDDDDVDEDPQTEPETTTEAPEAPQQAPAKTNPGDNSISMKDVPF